MQKTLNGTVTTLAVAEPLCRSLEIDTTYCKQYNRHSSTCLAICC